MALLPIVKGKDAPELRAKAKKIPKITKKVLTLIADMAETMGSADGVGLAAPQVGVPMRVCLAPVNGKFTALINPEITWKSDETAVDEEGCLSLPGIYLPVRRSTGIIVTYTDPKNGKHEYRLENFEARVVQHEVDHLDGILIVDKPEAKSSL